MNQKKTGTFIAACRKEHEMTQMQFAEKLGVTNKAVSKWETGKCMPDASLFDDICLLLGISLNELFAGERIPSENIIEKTEQNPMKKGDPMPRWMEEGIPAIRKGQDFGY